MSEQAVKEPSVSEGLSMLRADTKELSRVIDPSLTELPRQNRYTVEDFGFSGVGAIRGLISKAEDGDVESRDKLWDALQLFLTFMQHDTWQRPKKVNGTLQYKPEEYKSMETGNMHMRRVLITEDRSRWGVRQEETRAADKNPMPEVANWKKFVERHWLDIITRLTFFVDRPTRSMPEYALDRIHDEPSWKAKVEYLKKRAKVPLAKRACKWNGED